jgi:hypothetical protein
MNFLEINKIYINMINNTRNIKLSYSVSLLKKSVTIDKMIQWCNNITIRDWW